MSNKADPSLFVLHQCHTIILLLIYVVDLLLTGNNPTTVVKLISTFAVEFSLKDLGCLHYFHGVKARYIPRGIFLSQTKYVFDLLSRAKMLDSSHMKIALAVKHTYTP